MKEMTKNFSYICSCCYKNFEKVQRCSKCKIVKYCSKKCQISDWVYHKKECSKLFLEKQQELQLINQKVTKIVKKKQKDQYFCFLFENRNHFNKEIERLHFHCPVLKKFLEENISRLPKQGFKKSKVKLVFNGKNTKIITKNNFVNIKKKFKKKKILVLFKSIITTSTVTTSKIYVIVEYKIEKYLFLDKVDENWKIWGYIDGMEEFLEEEHCKKINAKTNFEKYEKFARKLQNYKERLEYIKNIKLLLI